MIQNEEHYLYIYGEVKKGWPGFLPFKCPLKGVAQYLEMSVVIGFEKATMHAYREVYQQRVTALLI